MGSRPYSDTGKSLELSGTHKNIGFRRTGTLFPQTKSGLANSRCSKILVKWMNKPP